MKPFTTANQRPFARRAMHALLQKTTLLALALALAISFGGCGGTMQETDANSLTPQERVEALLNRDNADGSSTNSSSTSRDPDPSSDTQSGAASVVPGGYLYNRAHLIGFQLTGENANKENRITGTQSFNVSGMLPYESMVADYVQETGNHVYYRVTPIFDGTDLLARGVLIEAVSVEDGGAGIQFNVFCYNVQDGIAIDYATGENYQMALLPESSSASSVASSVASTTPAPTSTPTPTASLSETLLASYVLNISSKKIHMPDCRYVDSISEENKLYTSEPLDNLYAQGYEDCKVCDPQ